MASSMRPELSDHYLLVHVQILSTIKVESKELESVWSAILHELLGLCAFAQSVDSESLEVRQSGFQVHQLLHQRLGWIKVRRIQHKFEDGDSQKYRQFMRLLKRYLQWTNFFKQKFRLIDQSIFSISLFLSKIRLYNL